jgi:hypothetical protein
MSTGAAHADDRERHWPAPSHLEATSFNEFHQMFSSR